MEIYTYLLILVICLIHYWVDKFIKIYSRNSLFDRIEFIIYLFDDMKELIYQKLWREEILTQITSGYNFDPNESYSFRDKYIKLVIKNCGSHVLEDLMNIYGDLDAITVNIGNHFMIKIDKQFTELGLGTTNKKFSELVEKK